MGILGLEFGLIGVKWFVSMWLVVGRGELLCVLCLLGITPLVCGFILMYEGVTCYTLRHLRYSSSSQPLKLWISERDEIDI